MKRTKEILISILLLAFVVYFFRIVTQIGQTADSGLISYWSMNEGADTPSTCNATVSTVYDYVGSNNGDLNLDSNPATSTAWTDGKLSCGLDLDGVNDYVEIGDKPDLQFGTGDFTVATWFYFNGDTLQDAIVAKRNGSSPFNQYSLFICNGHPDGFGSGKRLLAFIRPDGGSTSYDRKASTTADLTVGWHHAAMVQDYDSKLTLYLDGVEVSSDASSHAGLTVNISGRSFQIGKGYNGFNFDGIVDDVRVYNRVLTAGEVEALAGLTGAGLISHWKMDEGADTLTTCNASLLTVQDYEGSNDGSLNLGGSPDPSVAWVDGKLICGLDLDGTNDYVNMGDVLNFGADEDFTIAAWINTADADGYIAQKVDSSGSIYYYLGVFSNKLRLKLKDANGNNPVIESTGNVNDGSWHHVAAVRDAGNNLYLYVDGVSAAIPVSDYTNSTLSNTGAFELGQRSNGGSYKYPFDGILDEIRVYNRALTAAEIEELATAGFDFKALWKFDEGTGSTAADVTGAYDGNLVNGTAWLPSSSCRVDGCLYFDSDNDAVEINGEPIGTGAGSACAWIYPISGGTDPYPRILDNGRFLLYVQAGDEIAFTSDTNTYLQTTTDVVNYNTWQHVCAVRDASGNAKIYIDGVEKASGPSGVPTAGSTNLSIGNRADYTRTFYGRIDDVRLYGEVLTETEIQVLASMGTEEPPPEEISTNVFGWAWNDAFGWTSFNCINCEGDSSCDKTATCNGTHPNYGVFIDEATGILSGYAWSEGVGWFSFNQTDLSGCPIPPCWAYIDLESGQVSGWARILSGFWLRLRDTDYGVYLDSSSEFRGHAWSDEFGWLSFNHLNCDSNSNGASDQGNYSNCPLGQAVSDYMVWTDIPFTPELPSSAPTAVGLGVEERSYCDSPNQFFSWTFQDPDVGDSQIAYRIQVDKEGTFVSFGAGELDSGKVYNPISEHRNIVAQYPGEKQLGYNQPYFWRLKVWDSNEMESEWISGSPFTTPTHIYPTPGFDWTPVYPAAGEVVQFCAVNDGVSCFEENSTCYNNSNSIISCSGKSFLWSFPLGTEFETGSAETTENPQVKLNEENAEVSLQITDNMGACTTTETINITLPLPKWKETPPK